MAAGDGMMDLVMDLDLDLGRFRTEPAEPALLKETPLMVDASASSATSWAHAVDAGGSPPSDPPSAPLWRSGFVPTETLKAGFDTVAELDLVRCHIAKRQCCLFTTLPGAYSPYLLAPIHRLSLTPSCVADAPGAVQATGQ